jgi:uncharacterized phage protein (TIGR01671 family)
MKEIKFRYWNHFKKEMIYKNIHEIVLGCLGINLNEEYLMLFTGFRDDTGKEIYDGDILMGTATESIKWYCVKYEKGSFVLYHKYSERWGLLAKFEELCEEFNIECKIIGNIYENPELLT